MFADFSGNPNYYLLGFPVAVAVWVGLPALAVFLSWRAIVRSRSRRRFLRLPEGVDQS